MSVHRLLLLTAPIALSLACNSGPIGSCDTRTVSGGEAGLCRTWTGERTASEDQFKNLCTTTYSGTFTGGADCSSDGRLGTCYTDQLFGLYLTYSYYSPAFTAQTAEAACLARTECTASSCQWRPTN